MIFETKEITLKNGKTAILKTPEISDAAGMLVTLHNVGSRPDVFKLKDGSYRDEYYMQYRVKA